MSMIQNLRLAVLSAILLSWHPSANAQQTLLQHAGAQIVLSQPNRTTFIPVPSLTMDGHWVSTRPLTASEAATLTMAARAKLSMEMISPRNGRYPVDSLRAGVAAAGKRWLATLQHQQVRGIQMDPFAHVSVMAEQETFAKAQIAARLATRGLSLTDKAHTLRMAVEAFGADPHSPDRLPVAEGYLKDLEAMGDAVAAWQYDARQTLIATYYMLGRSDDVIRQGTKAIELLPRIPYADRNFNDLGDMYGPTIEALAGKAGTRQQIDRLNAILRVAAVPAPNLIASDSAYYWLAEGMPQSIEHLISGNARLGTSAAPLTAHYWINPSRDSTTVRVNDGKIRIVELANTGCPGCVFAMYGMQRLYAKFPQIEPVMVTFTSGSWANRLVEPAEEVAHLTDFFVNSTKVTFPVGIWAGKKIPNEDGGMSPMGSINNVNYPTFGKPMLWVIDGHGKIRRIFTGYGMETYTQLQSTIEFLLREAAMAPASIALQ
jgi:hypothetical protein